MLLKFHLFFFLFFFFFFLILNNPRSNAGFRLTCRLPHCHFDDDISSTAQASLATEGWPSGKQRLANRPITLPFCPPRQIADSWIQFNSGAIAARWKAKAALSLRAATLKQQAMITRHSGERQVSLKPALQQPHCIILLKLTQSFLSCFQFNAWVYDRYKENFGNLHLFWVNAVSSECKSPNPNICNNISS